METVVTTKGFNLWQAGGKKIDEPLFAIAVVAAPSSSQPAPLSKISTISEMCRLSDLGGAQLNDKHVA